MKKYIALTLGVSLMAGCVSKPVPVSDKAALANLVGQRVTLVGMAFHDCPGAVVYDKDCIVLIDGLKYWPTNYDHQRVEVTGQLQVVQAPHLYKVDKAHWALAP